MFTRPTVFKHQQAEILATPLGCANLFSVLIWGVTQIRTRSLPLFPFQRDKILNLVLVLQPDKSLN